MATILITGANRGIGIEFARQYAAAGDRVLGTCRRPEAAAELEALDGDVSLHCLDVTDQGAIKGLARKLDGEAIDIVINNAGVLGSGQRDGSIDYAAWENELRVNTIAPIAMAEAFAPHVARSRQKRMAFITSRMGSIADNTGGGYIPYRSSKAALNAAVTSLSLDLAPMDITVLLFHPGWVRTDMGGPSAMIDAKTSVAGMRRLIADANPRDSGRFRAFDGVDIPW